MTVARCIYVTNPMTAQLAKQQLAKLQQERAVAESTVLEYQSRIELLDAQMAALKPLAEEAEVVEVKKS